MALQNHPDLYTGGAVTLNSNPFMQFQANMMARKQAKDEALEEYYRNLTKGVNPAGVRTVDLPDFDKKVGAMREFWGQNREAIKYPMKYGGAAQTKYNQLMQDALNHVQMSKNEEEKKKPLIELLTDPNKRDRVPDSVLFDLGLHDLGLNDPRRKSFDISKLSFDPKDIDWNKYLGSFKDIEMSKGTPSIVSDPKTMTRTTTTPYFFDDNAFGAIQGRAAQSYLTDSGIKNYVDKKLVTEDGYKRLNPAFKKMFKRDILHPEDFLTAAIAEGLQKNRTEVKTEDDVFARQKAMEAIRTANDKELIRYRKSIDPNDTELNNLWVDSYLNKIVSDARGKKENLIEFKFKDGRKINGYEIEVDPTLEKALGFSPDNKGVLIVTPEGKFIRSFYKTDETGKLVGEKGKQGKAMREELTTELSQDQLKLALGAKALSPTQRSKEMLGGQSNSKYSIKGKTYTEKELLKMGYTIEQIAPYKQ